MSTSTMDVQAMVAESLAERSPEGIVTIKNRTPACTCGWAGRRRAALFLARHDAWMHAATTGCRPGVPLVLE